MYTYGQVEEAFNVLRELISEEGADPDGRFLLDDIQHDVLNRLVNMAGQQPHVDLEPPIDVHPVTYRLEMVKCGSQCRCNDGKGHGPYWYAYWSEGRKRRCKYIGKVLRVDGIPLIVDPGTTEVNIEV